MQRESDPRFARVPRPSRAVLACSAAAAGLVGLTQVRGEPLYEMRPFEPWYTAAGVEHWHGAHPQEEARQLTIYGGTVDWLEPVEDAVYRAPSRRR